MRFVVVRLNIHGTSWSICAERFDGSGARPGKFLTCIYFIPTLLSPPRSCVQSYSLDELYHCVTVGFLHRTKGRSRCPVDAYSIAGTVAYEFQNLYESSTDLLRSKHPSPTAAYSFPGGGGRIWSEKSDVSLVGDRGFRETGTDEFVQIAVNKCRTTIFFFSQHLTQRLLGKSINVHEEMISDDLLLTIRYLSFCYGRRYIAVCVCVRACASPFGHITIARSRIICP